MTYSHVLFDFFKMTISFKKEKRTIELKGMVEEAKL
jgi:hypothetical protein